MSDPVNREDYFSLEGKRALVVGGENPIGRAIALALAESGADVAISTVLAGSDGALGAKKTADAIARLGRNTLAESADTTTGTGAQVMVRQVAKALGGLDLLVNAQQTFLGKPFESVSDAEVAKVIAANLASPIFTCRAAIKEMLKGSGGAILNVTSGLGQRGMQNSVVYGATEGGVNNLTRGIAIEYGRRGIRANVLALGWFESTPGAGPNDPQENKLLRYIPMRRFGRPEEVGPLAVYLCSDSAGYLNGQVYNVDGGALARL